MQGSDRAHTISAFADEYGLLNEIVASLRAEDLLASSGCEGWINADLLFHMLLDAQRALVTFNTPGIAEPDKDFVTYWQSFAASDEGSRSHARFVRISAAAHQDPMQICSRWIQTSEAAIRACRTSELDLVATQGHVLSIADFVATLVVEAAIHHLDLVKYLEGKPGPAPSAVAITTATLDGLLGKARPPHWDDETYILKATGRQALDARDRRELGAAADSIPVFS
jgi:Mycothiol maleylpyruvate isomerase N-terminal domain